MNQLPAIGKPQAPATALRSLVDRALGRQDPATGLLRLRAFVGDGEAVLQRCRQARQAVSLAVFNAGDVIHDASLDRGLVAAYAEAVVGCLKALAGPVGLVARAGSAEFTVLMPLANERVARHMIAHEFGLLKTRIGWALGSLAGEVALAPPACAVFGIADAAGTLEQLQHEARRQVQDRSGWSRPAEDEPDTEITATEPVPLIAQACDGALVAMEVDPMEWIRANEHPTTMHAPLR